MQRVPSVCFLASMRWLATDVKTWSSSCWNTAYHVQAQECPARRFYIMTSRTLYRLSGGTLIVGSLLLSIGTVLTSTLYGNATPQQILSLSWLLVGLMFFIGSLLFLILLPGMYLRHAARARVLCIFGFSLLFSALLLAGVVFI